MTDRVKTAEFGGSGAVVEVYQKFSGSAQKIFFDVTCVAECVEGMARYLLPVLRIEHVPRLVIAVLEAMTYISERHKEIRGAIGTRAPEDLSLKCYGIADIDPADVCAQVSAVKEFKRGGVVVEVVVEEKGDVEVFSVCCWREYANSSGSRDREFFIQQRDLRNLCIALLEAWSYVQENWGSTPVTKRRW